MNVQRTAEIVKHFEESNIDISQRIEEGRVNGTQVLHSKDSIVKGVGLRLSGYWSQSIGPLYYCFLIYHQP